MKISLFYCQGTSDKVYHLAIEKEGSGFVVNFSYGRRGSCLKVGQKTSCPVPYEEAEQIYNKILREKLGKGYQEGTPDNPGRPTPQECSTQEAPREVGRNLADFAKVKPKLKAITAPKLPQLLNPIDSPDFYLKSDAFLAQEKIDGERRIVEVVDGKVTQYNRKGQAIPFFELFNSPIKYDCVLDGEVIGDQFYIFDLLQLEGKDTTQLKCFERIALLNSLSFGKGIHIVPTASSAKDKKKLYETLLKKNKEGIVFKRTTSLYTPGRPPTGGDFFKFKFWKSATFIVKDITKGKRSIGLALLDGDKQVALGKCTVAPNKELPPVGSLVEVRYLYCYKGGSVYQPTYLGQRTDLDTKEAKLSQIIYKAENEDN